MEIKTKDDYLSDILDPRYFKRRRKYNEKKRKLGAIRDKRKTGANGHKKSK